MADKILHNLIAERINDIFHTTEEIPNYIQDNLNHHLRGYQKEALQHFIYTQESDNADLSFNHLLFHMATGSGKTVVLAATILYLFREQNQQNFIFFVNSDAIIKKTYDNLSNVASPKYLFNKEGIEIDGNKITIQLVDSFPVYPADHTIYLKLTTIQKLHMDLTNPRENGVTFDSLEDQKVVLLADEAHHINVVTKTSKKKLTGKEAEEKTWEHTVNRLLNLNPQNRLLEFTATVDLSKDELYEKYRDKIVYQYDLKRFMQDGYSKNVVLLRTNEEDSNKMLQAVLLSQYRKYIAKDHDIDLKPIILFKSNKIATSKEANNTFFDIIQNLTVGKLQKILENGLNYYQNTQSIWNRVYRYYNEQNLAKIIRDLQWDFTNETTINANSQSFLEEENALLLNTLEEKNNPIRTIFAVAKLNEGWDVLNLFDIVRISEGATNTKNTTSSEAQLIGRGARYYPFQYHDDISYTRRFDYEASELKIVETLHYHTINESKYIKNLHQSLNTANIEVKEDQYNRLEAKVKPSIKKEHWFKHGKIYINQVVPTTAEDYQSLQDYNVYPDYDYDYQKVIEQSFATDKEIMANNKRHTELFVPNKRTIQKAIQRNPFYHFKHLSYYVPSITSMKQFIDNDAFLGQTRIHVSLPSGMSIDALSPKRKLHIVENYLKYVETTIRNNFMKNRGTPVFEGVAIPEFIHDYVIEVNKVTNTDQIIQEKNMRNQDWFIYDKAYVNNLENDFIDLITGYMDSLQEEYEDVYLIRNERKVKIVEIGGTRGFMPDFLLYMKDHGLTYQVFLEPKGQHLLEKDQWKEEFLVSLRHREDLEVLTENDNVRLLGIQFYSDDAAVRSEFRKDFKEQLGIDSSSNNH